VTSSDSIPLDLEHESFKSLSIRKQKLILRIALMEKDLRAIEYELQRRQRKNKRSKAWVLFGRNK